MGASLVSFIFNTIQPRMNNPANATFFLPGLLNDMTSGGQNVLPLTAASWNLGVIGGSGGQAAANAFAQGWYSYTNLPPEGQDEHRGIPCPTSPYPSLVLNGVTVGALDNVQLDQGVLVTPLDTGYQIVIQLTQGAFSNVSGVTNGPITIASGYAVTQCVCTTGVNVPDPTACDGYVPADTVVGSGDFAGSIANLTMTVTATLGVGANGGIDVTVTSVVASAPQGTTVNVQSLTVANAGSPLEETVIQMLATNALTSADAFTSLMQSLTATLNTPDNLNAIQSQLSDALNNGMNDVLGAVPPSGLVTDPMAPGTNPLDAYLFDRIHTSVATPGTDYYLPATLLFFQNPTLDPYTASSISIPDQTYDGITFSDITLTDLTVTGGSNAVLPAGQMSLSGNAVTGNASLSTLNPGPTLTSSVNGNPQTLTVPNPPLTLSAQFSITPGASPNPLTGSLAATASASQLQGVFTVGGSDISTLEITFTSVTLSAQPVNVQITVTLPGATGFAPLVNGAMNTPDAINGLISALNGEVGGQLGAISQTATTNVRNLATQKLDG